MQFDLEPGDYVINPLNKDWGIGQIQSIVKNKITVNFENYGKQVLNSDNITLEKIKMIQIDLKSIATKLIPTFNEAGELSVKLQKEGLKITIKEDNSPVTNGDIAVNDIITKKIIELTPDIPIISEETVKKDFKNTNKIFWLIDPIDGTKEYIAGKDEFTLNAALVINQIPVLSLVGVPKKNRLFYTYGKNESYLIENGKTEKINCKNKMKKTP